jgi:hypothetical protein
MAQFAEMNEVYETFFFDPKPVRTQLCVFCDAVILIFALGTDVCFRPGFAVGH